MIRRSFPRSTCTTTIRRPLADRPIVTKRASSVECSGSGIVPASGSPKTVDASSNETACFAKLAAAFRGSHWNLTDGCYRETSPSIRCRPNTGLQLRGPDLHERLGPAQPTREYAPAPSALDSCKPLFGGRHWRLDSPLVRRCAVGGRTSCAGPCTAGPATRTRPPAGQRRESPCPWPA